MSEQAPAPKEPTLSELREALVYATTLGGFVKDAQERLRAEVQRRQVAQYKENESKSFDATVEGLGKVGSLSLQFSSDKIEVTDAKAFFAWVEEQYPAAVHYPEPIPNEQWKPGYLEKLKADYATGKAFDPAKGGVEVPGVTAKKGGEVRGMTGLTGFNATNKLAVLDRLRQMSVQQVLPALPAAAAPAPVVVPDERTIDGEAVASEALPEHGWTAEKILATKRRQPLAEAITQATGEAPKPGKVSDLQAQLAATLGIVLADGEPAGEAQA